MTATQTISLELDVDQESLLGDFVDRAKFAKAAEAWSASMRQINDFEDEYLLGENPPAESLARHKKMVERLMFYGQVLATVTAHPDFEDSQTAAMIFATQQALRDSLRMFHHPMPKAEADRILKEVFPES
jgi:hypothetical protein